MSSDAVTLVRAASVGAEATVKRLLKAKVDVSYVAHELTALQAACANGRVGVARLLLEAKAAVDQHTEAAKATPLIGAASVGHALVVQLLLEAKASTTARNSKDLTALDLARLKGHAACVALLEPAASTPPPVELDPALE